MRVIETELTLSPDEALAAWPRLEPLAMMWSGGAAWKVRNPRCRWTVMSRPVETVTVKAGPGAGDEVRALMDRLGTVSGKAGGAGGYEPTVLPFVGGWMGYVSYEAGAELEAAVRGTVGGAEEGAWPLAVWQRCPGAYVHDRWTGQWWVVGDRDALPNLEDVKSREMGSFMLGTLRSDMGRVEYERRVARVVEYIRAGDIFQANLAHRLSGAFEGSTRGLFAELVKRAQPWHGAYLEVEMGEERGALVSMSPELFVEYDAGSRRVTTRPMKGTRPLRVGGTAASAAVELARSEKDAAELNMIVDLMRNDLGRVCRYGSIRVDEGRVIESHADTAEGGGVAGVLQGVATVSGELKEDAGLADLVNAAFPPGSVTGAPKIRAMQIIDELELSERGPYCGAIGYVSDHGRVGLNVAIRTAVVRGKVGGVAADEVADAELSYSVGAGIVADSKPQDEWRETLVKAGVIAGLTSLKEC